MTTRRDRRNYRPSLDVLPSRIAPTIYTMPTVGLPEPPPMRDTNGALRTPCEVRLGQTLPPPILVG